jgi:hypothetical protein
LVEQGADDRKVFFCKDQQVRLVDKEEAMRRRIPELERSYNPLLFKWLRNLQTKGWYPDPSLPAQKVRFLIAENEEGLADRARAMADTYSKQLATWHPERKKVLDRTFQAHARGEHELSVPLFLIQADGIGFDRLGKNPFFDLVEKRGHGKKGTRKGWTGSSSRRSKKRRRN